jgi:hypothetical protein
MPVEVFFTIYFILLPLLDSVKDERYGERNYFKTKLNTIHNENKNSIFKNN